MQIVVLGEKRNHKSESYKKLIKKLYLKLITDSPFNITKLRSIKAKA